MNEASLKELGMEVVKTPEQQVHAGIFQLPPDFDRTKFAAEWVEQENVPVKQQRNLMPQVGVTVPGLTVWKGDDGKGKPHVVNAAGGKKKFVLMCRPLKVQKAMNALYGNVTKRMINREVRGETAAGEGIQDPGILTEQTLRQVAGGSLAEESVQPLNSAVDEPSPAVST